jgi:hypothetical protein
LLFQGQLLPASGRFGATLHASIPLIPTWPEAPDASIVNLRTTLGPEGVTYYRNVHGHRKGFRPQGMAVPERCPRGGFPFQAKYRFQDGTSALARTSVPCPH